jgi:hypothetical protein
MSRTDPRAYTGQSTKDVRGKNFTVRLPGPDRDEVRSSWRARSRPERTPGPGCDAHPGENETLKHESQLLRCELREARAKPMQQGHRPGREGPQPGPAAGRFVDRRSHAGCS